MRKVITYGTYDLFHQGHYNIIKRAKEQGDYLIVGVTSESFDIERGKLNVRDSLLTRIENVKKTGLADEIIIEEYQGQKVNDIIKYNIDVIVLGSDWTGKFDYLKNYCEVMYLPRTRNISSTILRGLGSIQQIGILTDDLEDDHIVEETKYVSGLHVECVFSENEEVAKQFCSKYDIYSYETKFEEFLKNVDIIYVKCIPQKRAFYIDWALENNKYVICDPPVTFDKNVLTGLIRKAKLHHVVLIEKMTLVYLRAFHQLVWLSHGDLIGDLISVKCSIAQSSFKDGKSFDEALVYAICAVIKLLGKECTGVTSNFVRDGQENPIYGLITMKYENTIGLIEIGSAADIQDQMTLIGTKGRISVPGDWWNTGYFEAKVDGVENLKRFSSNFEGNGFRYLLQELIIMMNDHREECTRLFYEESEKILDVFTAVKGQKSE